MKYFVSIIASVFLSTASADQTNGLGLSPNGVGLNPFGGYGLSPEQLAVFKQLESINKQNYESMRAQAQRNSEQQSKVDPNLQKALLEAQAKVNWSATNETCSNKLQALAASTRAVLDSKEFVFNKDSVVVSDGKKTLVYGQKGLATVDGLGCSYDRSKSLRDGLQLVFNSTLPKAAPSDEDIKSDPAAARAHRERLKVHLETLRSCQSILGSDYVSEITNKYHMLEGSANGVDKSGKSNGVQ